MTAHTVRAFEDDLSELGASVRHMGDLVKAQVSAAVVAMVDTDAKAAAAIIEGDSALDRLEQEIEQRAIRIIALRQPMADDLRSTVAAMKIANNLERCGDLAKNIAKRALIVAQSKVDPGSKAGIIAMGRLVSQEMAEVLRAYQDRDIETVRQVWARDHAIDEHYNRIFRDLLAEMLEDPRRIEASAHLLFVGKNLERIGDHATNIAEIVHYQLTGDDISSEARPKSDALPV